MTKSRNKVLEEQSGFGYMVKDMERPKNFVTTIHGDFSIETYDRKGGCTTPMCYDCWYKKRRTTGAPCVEGTWCGHLHQYLVPVRLTQLGRELLNK